MDEAYPGAVYHHRGASYRIEGWAARNRKNRQPFIRAARMADSGRRTRPILRRTATLPQDPGCVINRRDLPGGHAAEMKILVTESVEGYEDPDEGVVLYQRQMLRDPRLSRKQREMPTTAVHLRISEPWFSGDSGEPWQARRQIAQALRLHLAYHQSIALPDLGFQAENVIMETPMGYVELNDSIVIHDNIHGGMRLVGSLYRNIGRYAKNLNVSTEDEPGAVYPQYASELVRWLEQVEEAGMREQKEPGENDWWRVVRAGREVRMAERGPLPGEGGRRGHADAGRAADASGKRLRLGALAALDRPPAGTAVQPVGREGPSNQQDPQGRDGRTEPPDGRGQQDGLPGSSSTSGCGPRPAGDRQNRCSAESTPNGPRGERDAARRGERRHGKGQCSPGRNERAAWTEAGLETHRHPNGRIRSGGGSLRRPDRQQHRGSHYDTSRTTPRLAQDMAPVSGVRRPGPPQHRRGRTQPGTADAKAGDLRGAVGARREHAQCSLGHEPRPLHRRAGKGDGNHAGIPARAQTDASHRLVNKPT